MVKIKLPPRSGSVTLRQLNRIHKKGALKFVFFLNLHHAEASQLIFREFQMTGLHVTQDLTERRHRKYLKIKS